MGSDAVTWISSQGERERVADEWPPRLELVRADPRELRFGGRQRARAPILLCPLILLLAAVPWFSGEPVTGVRLAVSALCLGAAGAIARWCWPRAVHVRLRRDDEEGGSASSARPRADVLRWILVAETERDSPTSAYALRVELGGVEAGTVLRGPAPDAILRQLHTLLVHWPGCVDCRWGLPLGARPWSFEPRLDVSPAAEPTRAMIRAPACDKVVSWTMAGMTLLMLADLTFLVLSESAKLPRIHPLSLLLPSLLAGCLATISLSLATASACLSVTTRLFAEECVLGVRQLRGLVRLTSVRGVHVIGAAASERWHLLIDSADGPLALPVSRSQADRLARQARLTIAGARAEPPISPTGS